VPIGIGTYGAPTRRPSGRSETRDSRQPVPQPPVDYIKASNQNTVQPVYHSPSYHLSSIIKYSPSNLFCGRTVPSGFDSCRPLTWLVPLSPSLLASCDSIFRFVSCGFSLLFLCSSVCLLFACGVEAFGHFKFTFPICVASRFFNTARLSSIITEA
jgi:hypothetical protein